MPQPGPRSSSAESKLPTPLTCSAYIPVSQTTSSFTTVDEPSLGLAPLVVETIFGIIRRLAQERGQTVLLVEQNAALALEVADHGYVMENGRIVMEGPAASLRENPEIREFYLGLNEVGARRSYRDVHQYRRRRRVSA